MITRATILAFFFGSFLACGAAPSPEREAPASAPASDAASAPASEETARDPKSVAVALTDILNDGAKVDAFLARMAPAVEVRMLSACGEAPPKEETAMLSSEVAKRAWYEKSVSWWAKSCAEENPPPSCRWGNPLNFMEEKASCDGGCCTLPGPGLHNTPFLTRVCVDAAGKVSALTIEDGC